MPYIIRQRRLWSTPADTPTLYLKMQYWGWGHREGIDWVQSIDEARTWSEKSGAYKLISAGPSYGRCGREVIEVTAPRRCASLAPVQVQSDQLDVKARLAQNLCDRTHRRRKSLGVVTYGVQQLVDQADQSSRCSPRRIERLIEDRFIILPCRRCVVDFRRRWQFLRSSSSDRRSWPAAFHGTSPAFFSAPALDS